MGGDVGFIAWCWVACSDGDGGGAGVVGLSGARGGAGEDLELVGFVGCAAGESLSGGGVVGVAVGCFFVAEFAVVFAWWFLCIWLVLGFIQLRLQLCFSFFSVDIKEMIGS